MRPDALVAWWRRNRRRVIGLALVCAFFFALGYFSPRVNSPVRYNISG